MDKNRDIRRKIIESASDLISRKGIAGTTLAEIAGVAEISKGTLYYYYSSKSSLILDIAENHMDHLTNSLMDIIKKNKGKVSWQGMLKELLTRVISSETRTRLHIYLLQEILSGETKLKENFTRTYNSWFNMISEAYQLITGKKKDITVEAGIFVAAIDGLIIQHTIGFDKTDFDDVVKKLSVIIGE